MTLFLNAIKSMRGVRDGPPPDAPVWSYLRTDDGAIRLTDGLTHSYSEMYRRQAWVYAGVNVLARSVARTPLKVYSGRSDNRSRVWDGPLPDLLAKPAEFLIPFAMKEQIVIQTILYGYAIVVQLGKINDSDLPESLWVAPCRGWKRGDGGTYIFTSASGDVYTFQPWQVIHVHFADTVEDGLGMSMLEPLRMTLAVEDAAQKFAVAAFRNGARPSSIVKTDQKLHPDAAKATAAMVHAVHGGADNAFKVAVLEQGLDWAPWPAQNLDESALVQHRQLTRQEVAAVLNIPQPMMGILDEGNFASIDALHVILYQDTLSVYLKLIEESFQAQLLATTPAWTDLTVEFDMHGLMRGSDADQYRNYATALSAGFLTPNEVRARENLPPSPQPEADLLHFPLASSSGAVGATIAESTGAPDNTQPGAMKQNGVAAHV